jgi:hypothetical protein
MPAMLLCEHVCDLFERSLNPDKRSRIGAHYTSPQNILLIVEPVVMAPLEARWAVVKAEAALADYEFNWPM